MVQRPKNRTGSTVERLLPVLGLPVRTAYPPPSLTPITSVRGRLCFHPYFLGGAHTNKYKCKVLVFPFIFTQRVASYTHRLLLFTLFFLVSLPTSLDSLLIKTFFLVTA